MVRVWWIRVPWNLSKMLREAVRIGWLGSGGLGFLGIYLNCYRKLLGLGSGGLGFFGISKLLR